MAITKPHRINIRLSEEELALLHRQMEIAGVINTSAFLRKMAIDGMIIKLDMPEIQDLLSLLRRANANINQIAKHLHESGRIYEHDLQEILSYQKEIHQQLNSILTSLANLK